MIPRATQLIAHLRGVALCSLVLLHAADVIGAPSTILLDRDRPEFADAEIEVQGLVRASFPNLAAAVASFHARLDDPNAAAPNTRLIASLEGYDFFSLTGVRLTETPRQLGTSLIARHAATGAAWILVEVFIDEGLGAATNVESFRSPAGPLLRIPVRLSGTGAMNRDLLFLWKSERLSEIDAHSWLTTLRLGPLGFAPGAGIRKGVTVNPADFSARTDVWNEADANCCPSAGYVDVVLRLRGGKLEVQRAMPRPATSSQSGLRSK